MFTKVALILLAAMITPQETEVSTADQVIDKYIDALGGEMYLRGLAQSDIKITSRYRSGVLDMKIVAVLSDGRHWIRQHDIHTNHWFEAWYDGETGWSAWSLNGNVQSKPKASTNTHSKPGPTAFDILHNRALKFVGNEYDVAADQFADQAVWRLTSGDHDWLFSTESGLLIGYRRRDYTDESKLVDTRFMTIEYREIDNKLWPCDAIMKRRIVQSPNDSERVGDVFEHQITDIKLDADISGVKFRPDK